MIPFHVDDYMRDRAAGLMLLLGETRDEVEEKVVRDIIRDGKDLIRRLEAKLPKKRSLADEEMLIMQEKFCKNMSAAANAMKDEFITDPEPVTDEDLIRRLESKLPGKRQKSIEDMVEDAFSHRYTVYAWTPYYIGGGRHEYLASFDSREAAMEYATRFIDPDFQGLQFWKIMDNEELRNTEIIVYPSLKWRGEDGNDRASGEDISGDAKEPGTHQC